jgi:flagellar basal body-associated protein FliL
MSTIDETNEVDEAQENDTDLIESEAETTESDSEAADEEAKPKKKKMKLGVKILIIVAAVIVVLGAGGGGGYLAVHDQPWFCNFICHTPMDPYVASYEEGVSINPLQTEGVILSVTLHKDSDQQLNCLKCHEPEMSEQIEEGLKWVTGDYELPVEMKIVAGEPKEGSGNKSGPTFCRREGCHTDVSSIEELKAVTAEQHRNPHDSHLGNQDCSNCHQTHEQSVMMCTQCHADAQVPEGWLTYQDQQKQIKAAAA